MDFCVCQEGFQSNSQDYVENNWLASGCQQTDHKPVGRVEVCGLSLPCHGKISSPNDNQDPGRKCFRVLDLGSKKESKEGHLIPKVSSYKHAVNVEVKI